MGNAHDETVVPMDLHSPTIAVEVRTRGLSALMLMLIHLKFDVLAPKKQKQKKQGWPQSKTSNAESFHNSPRYYSPKNKRSKEKKKKKKKKIQKKKKKKKKKKKS